MSMIQFTHNLMSGPKEQIPAMNRVKKIVKDANFTNRVFPMCIGYASWETDEVISEELYRNVLLALACVFLTTWMLLFNFTASLQVQLSFLFLRSLPKFMKNLPTYAERKWKISEFDQSVISLILDFRCLGASF